MSADNSLKHKLICNIELIVLYNDNEKMVNGFDYTNIVQCAVNKCISGRSIKYICESVFTMSFPISSFQKIQLYVSLY